MERRRTASRNSSSASSGATASRRSHTSPGLVPVRAAQIAVASRRAFSTPAWSSWAAASSSAWTTDGRGGAGGAPDSSTRPLLLPRQLHRTDQLVQVPVDHLGEVVGGEVDAVVGDPVLREVVGADFLRAVPGPHLGAALAGPRGLLLGDHAIEQPGAQDLERLDLVLELGLLVLALHLEARGEVGDAHRAVRGVDALPAGSPGAKHVDAQVFLLDLHVELLGLRQDGDGRR